MQVIVKLPMTEIPRPTVITWTIRWTNCEAGQNLKTFGLTIKNNETYTSVTEATF